MRTAILLVIPLALVVYSGEAQQTPSEEPPRPPQMKVELVLPKKTVKLGETVEVKYRLTSLVDGTLCFPQPAIEESGSFQGYLTLRARPLNGTGDVDLFIGGVWPRHPTDDEIRAAVASRWVKLGMSESYKTRKTDKNMRINVPGEWVLLGAYHSLT